MKLIDVVWREISYERGDELGFKKQVVTMSLNLFHRNNS
jgi:hypothetical protein